MKINVMVSVPVEIEGLPAAINPKRIGGLLQEYLNQWSDGRYPLRAEILRDALDSCVKHAVMWAVQENEQKKHPGEYLVTYDDNGRPNGNVATWVLTASEVMKTVDTHLRGDQVKASMA